MTKSVQRILLSIILAVVVAGSTLWGRPTSMLASDPVRVRVEDGRVFSGEVDARTDRDRLTLRVTLPSAVMHVAIPWSRIAGVSHAGGESTATEFRPISEGLKSALPADFFTDPVVGRGMASRPDSEDVAPLSSRDAASVRIDARAASWDSDVEYDGLELRLIALAADGSAIPVEGTIRAQLVGPNYTGRPGPFAEMGRWTQRVRLDDHGDLLGALYRLPFGSNNPEFDLQLGSYAILEVQLDVRGAGTLAASQQVRVRTPGSVRDQLQALEDRRFFTHERVSWQGR